MPGGMITATPSDSPTGQQKKGTQGTRAAIPFGRSSKLHIEQGNTVSGINLLVAAPGTFNFTLPSYGYLSAIFITCNVTGGTGAAAVYSEDAPWSVIQSILLQDVNGTPLWQLSGYHAFLASKYGGYRLYGPAQDNVAPATVNNISWNTPIASIYTTPTSGNFNFILPIYLELGRNGLACLPNMDASARYNLQIVLNSGLTNAAGPVYTTQPTTAANLAITVEVLCRSQPPATDLFGNVNSITPPAVGSAQYWTVQTFSSLTGAQTLQLSRVGNYVRNHILVFRDTSNNQPRTQAETADLPPTMEMDWDANIRYISNFATMRQHVFTTQGYDAPQGCLILPNTMDPDWIAISEFGDQWLPTVGATKLTLRFTPAASCSLSVLTNDFVPASGEVFAAPLLSEGY